MVWLTIIGGGGKDKEWAKITTLCLAACCATVLSIVPGISKAIVWSRSCFLDGQDEEFKVYQSSLLVILSFPKHSLQYAVTQALIVPEAARSR